MVKNTTPLEREEQSAFVDYCSSRGIKVVSTQNGFKMPKGNFNWAAYAKSLKRTGLAKGFPDLIVLARNKSQTHEVLFIEMKRQKGGVLHQEQKEWIQKLDEGGYCVGVAKGCMSAIQILENYLKT